MKAYTDIEQSKKLAKILPIESADMYWWYNGQKYYAETKDHNDFQKSDIPCWSLAALLGLIPDPILTKYGNTWNCATFDMEYHFKDETFAEELIDACYEMIIKLHEQKLL